MLRTSRVLCVLLKGFPGTERTECLIVPALCLLIFLVQLSLKVCEPALKSKEISCAEPVEFAEDEGLIVWIGSYDASHSRETSLLWHVFDIH